jgi:integrase
MMGSEIRAVTTERAQDGSRGPRPCQVGLGAGVGLVATQDEHHANLGATEVARLRQHRRTQIAHRLAAGPAYQDHDLVFASSVGTAMEPTTLDRIWRRIVADAGVGHVTFHGLRHAMASLLLTQNVHPKVVSERLGHSNVNVTMTIYSHVMPTLQADAAAMLDALLAPSAPADADIV